MLSDIILLASNTDNILLTVNGCKLDVSGLTSSVLSVLFFHYI